MVKKLAKEENGITIISLVVAIVILLILVSVTITAISENNGLFHKVQEAREQNAKSRATERLELVLEDLTIEKHTKSDYNETTYIDKKLRDENMKVEGNVVIVDGFKFEIDRSVPKILSDEELSEASGISIEANFVGTTPYLKGNLYIEIRSEKTICQIIIDDVNIQIPERNENGIYILEGIEVTQNRAYTIVAKAEDGETEILTKNITQIVEEDTVWEIRNTADIKKIRDAVNTGNSFKGKTINITADIDLEGSVEEKLNSWTPIGTEKNPFEGTFEGNNHVIKNLYIETTNDYQGLFGYNKGIIQNLIIENGNVKSESGTNIALAVGANEGTISNITTNGFVNGTVAVAGVVGWNVINGHVMNCINNAEISYNTVVKGSELYGGSVGGIVGSANQKNGNDNRIEKCVNNGDVTGARITGGIVGAMNNGGTIYLCTNNGEIIGEKSRDNETMVGGIAGELGWSISVTVDKCVNTGQVSATVSPLALGGIVGRGAYCTIKNSYNLGKIISGYGITGYTSTTTQNNYWLRGCGAPYGKRGSNNSGAEPKTKKELEELANQLIAKKGEEKELGDNLLNQLEKIIE